MNSEKLKKKLEERIQINKDMSDIFWKWYMDTSNSKEMQNYYFENYKEYRNIYFELLFVLQDIEKLEQEEKENESKAI